MGLTLGPALGRCAWRLSPQCSGCVGGSHMLSGRAAIEAELAGLTSSEVAPARDGAILLSESRGGRGGRIGFPGGGAPGRNAPSDASTPGTRPVSVRPTYSSAPRNPPPLSDSTLPTMPPTELFSSKCLCGSYNQSPEEPVGGHRGWALTSWRPKKSTRSLTTSTADYCCSSQAPRHATPSAAGHSPGTPPRPQVPHLSPSSAASTILTTARRVASDSRGHAAMTIARSASIGPFSSPTVPENVPTPDPGFRNSLVSLTFTESVRVPCLRLNARTG